MSNVNLGDNKEITISIDNEEQILQVKPIDKTLTYIDLKDDVDTPLYEDIVIKAYLYYSKKKNNQNNSFIDTTPDDDDTTGIGTWLVTEEPENIDNREIINTNGKAYVCICDLNNRVIYEKTVDVNHGVISATFNNALQSNTYKLKIKFLGNQLYEESNYQSIFQVSKRPITCTFEHPQYYASPGTITNVKGKLTDSINKKTINNYTIQYIYNNEINDTTSNEKGEIQINLLVPNPNIEHCQNSDDDINYPLTVLLENNNTYELQQTTIPIIPKKINTTVNINNLTVNDENNPTSFTVSGYVNTNTHIPYASYGKVTIYFPKNNYETNDIEISNIGYFSKQIQIKDIEDTSHNESYEDIYELTTLKNTNITLTVDKNTIQRGDYINVKAHVKNNNKDVIDGMVAFSLQRDGKELYRYVSELNTLGEATFNFLTSRIGDYFVKVNYYDGLLGYKESETTTDKIEVRE